MGGGARSPFSGMIVCVMGVCERARQRVRVQAVTRGHEFVHEDLREQACVDLRTCPRAGARAHVSVYGRVRACVPVCMCVPVR